MTRRFAIVETSEYTRGDVVHYFSNSSRASAIDAFRTLYGEQPQYVLFEQVACSEPAGSCNEADNASGKDRVQQNYWGKHDGVDDIPF